MILISISNFFEMASLFTFATCFFNSFLNSFQCFARALFCLNSSMFSRSVSVSALHVSCNITGSINVIVCAESMRVLAVEFDGDDIIDRVLVRTGRSDELFATNRIRQRHSAVGCQDVSDQAIIPPEAIP